MMTPLHAEKAGEEFSLGRKRKLHVIALLLIVRAVAATVLTAGPMPPKSAKLSTAKLTASAWCKGVPWPTGAPLIRLG